MHAESCLSRKLTWLSISCVVQAPSALAKPTLERACQGDDAWSLAAWCALALTGFMSLCQQHRQNMVATETATIAPHDGAMPPSRCACARMQLQWRVGVVVGKYGIFSNSRLIEPKTDFGGSLDTDAPWQHLWGLELIN